MAQTAAKGGTPAAKLPPTAASRGGGLNNTQLRFLNWIVAQRDEISGYLTMAQGNYAQTRNYGDMRRVRDISDQFLAMTETLAGVTGVRTVDGANIETSIATAVAAGAS